VGEKERGEGDGGEEGRKGPSGSLPRPKRGVKGRKEKREKERRKGTVRRPLSRSKGGRERKKIAAIAPTRGEKREGKGRKRGGGRGGRKAINLNCLVSSL